MGEDHKPTYYCGSFYFCISFLLFFNFYLSKINFSGIVSFDNKIDLFKNGIIISAMSIILILYKKIDKYIINENITCLYSAIIILMILILICREWEYKSKIKYGLLSIIIILISMICSFVLYISDKNYMNLLICTQSVMIIILERTFVFFWKNKKRENKFENKKGKVLSNRNKM